MKEIQSVLIKDLKLESRNPRKITKSKFKDLCDSMKKDPNFIYYRPILVYEEDNELIVYAGNQRVRAAKNLGYTSVPCILDKKEDLTEEIIRHRIIIDNRHAGDFDYDMLANDWDLNELLGMGFDPKEFDISLEDEKPKKKKMEMCPHCGKEI